MSAERSGALVTVIIPCLDEGHYLKQAVTSVLEQTHSNTVPVVVKDGPFPSPWLDGLAAAGRLRLVSLPTHQGTPNALNAGIAASRDADYIARLDADDVSRPERIERQVAAIEAAAPDVAMIASRARLIDSDGRPVVADGSKQVTGFTRENLLVRNVLTHSSILARGEVFRALGGYDRRCVRMQDYELYLRLALSYDIQRLDEPLVDYRLHGDQFSRRTKPWAPYIGIVASARIALASRLGESLLRQRGRNLLWLGAQWLRWLGLRKAGFDVTARRGGVDGGGDDTEPEPE